MYHFSQKLRNTILTTSLLTLGSLCAMETAIEPTNKYELFKVVQRIHELVEETEKEFSKDELEFFHDEKKARPGSNPYWNQTEQGLFFKLARCPYELYTPSGSVSLTSGFEGGTLGASAFNQSFLNKIDATFFKLPEPYFEKSKSEEEIYELKPDLNLKAMLGKKENIKWGDMYNKISRKELSEKVGKKTIIKSDMGESDPIYKILAVDGKPLPDPEFLPRDQYRDYKTVKKEWKEFEERYQQEKGLKRKENKSEDWLEPN